MTETLHIDPDSRLEAVRRQLTHYRGRQIVLLLPDGWSELDNTARMRLLQRQAQIQRSELALVTRQEATRKVASALGIPVFNRIEEAEERHWRMDPALPLVDLRKPAAGLPDPPPWRRPDLVQRMARPTLHQARQQRIRSEARYRQLLPTWLRLVGYSFAGALIVLLLGGFTIYVLPAATVTVTPGRAVVNTVVPLTANPDIDAPDLEVNLLPGRLVETSLELTGTLATTGLSQRPTDKATGTVVFVNTGSAPVSIPVGTVVSTGTGTPVRFRTVSAAELAGGQGAQVSVPIEALDPGVSGNTRANSISVVEGAMRFRVTVLNSNGTFGGGSQLAPTVTQADRDNLLAQLQEQTQARALETLQRELEPGEWLPPETVKTFVIAQAFSAFNDEETPELGLTLRTLIQGVAVNEATTREAMLSALQRAIPERGM
nr:baseplate J/gp47 family protein [Caldilineaceae bacterium]